MFHLWCTSVTEVIGSGLHDWGFIPGSGREGIFLFITKPGQALRLSQPSIQ